MRITCRGNTTLLIAALAVGCSTGAFAVDYTAFILSDSNDGVCGTLNCSLRDAILVTNVTSAEDTVNLGAGTYTLSLLGRDDAAMWGDLDITEDLNIVGQGADLTIIDADRIDRVFHVIGAGVNVRFYDLTIRGGGNILQSDNGGGGIRIEGGSVYLFRCKVIDNHTGSNLLVPTYLGGGLHVADGGYLNLRDSTVTDNWAGHVGGGIAVAAHDAILFMDRSTVSGNEDNAWGGGGVYNVGTAQIANSTISGNRTLHPEGIGGLWNCGGMILDSCTVTGNQARALHTCDNVTTTIKNTILHGPCSIGDNSIITSQGGNLESPGDTCGLTHDVVDNVNVADPMISPLGDHGGYTKTHVPVPGSPAIDELIADANCRAEDQREFSRPQDGDNDTHPFCDIGAVEYVWGEFIKEIFVDGFEQGTTAAWSASVP